jgi:FkbH-like protein
MSNPTDIPAICKAEWQAKLFAATPRRSQLLSLKPMWPCRSIKMRVHRNMPFEFVASALPAFLSYADLSAEIPTSDYDDALNFHLEFQADCELIWLDYSRYSDRFDAPTLAQWLFERLQALRAATTAPILVADGGGASKDLNERLKTTTEQIAGCRIFPRQSLQDSMGAGWFDDRVKEISASRMSDAATVATARLLGLVWLPAAVGVGLKALAIDLDNTLYEGVLGEDGVEGVHLTEQHLLLQQKIAGLKQQGILLTLLSRNEHADVEALFSTRTDFPLRWEDFAATSIGWQEKAIGLQELATRLRIHADAFLVLDDNLGEIANIAQRHPTTPALYTADAALAVSALSLFPRLHRWSSDKTDTLRANDLKASEARAAAQAQASDPIEYMRSLDIKLHFWLDPQKLLARLTDLANKTNQFILSLARLNEAEVARRLSNPDCATIAVNLSDKLSDSGVIAAIFCSKNADRLLVDEICVSCRALGRGIEDLMLATALEKAAQKLGTTKVSFAYSKGPRNDPARHWLESFVCCPLPGESGILHIDETILRRTLPARPVKISWE